MRLQVRSPRWSDRQRVLLTALIEAGGTQPDHAKSLSELPSLSSRELQALLDIGVVREAAMNRYYLYDRQVMPEDVPYGIIDYGSSLPPAGVRGFNWAKLLKLVVFWAIIILLPIILIQLAP